MSQQVLLRKTLQRVKSLGPFLGGFPSDVKGGKRPPWETQTPFGLAAFAEEKVCKTNLHIQILFHQEHIKESGQSYTRLRKMLNFTITTSYPKSVYPWTKKNVKSQAEQHRQSEPVFVKANIVHPIRLWLSH